MTSPAELDGERWGTLLDRADAPTYGALVDAVARADMIDADPEELVDAALADGVLVEDPDAGTFGEIHVDEAAAGGEDSQPPNTADMDTRGGENLADDPQGETDETALAESPLAEGRAVTAEDRHDPPGLIARDWWVAWILDGVGRKRPVAPWQNGHAYPAEWASDLDPEERPETEYETARGWAEFDLGAANMALPDDARSDDLGLGIILPEDRPPREERIALIDWDNVRDPETEEIHPIAAAYIREHGGYVEVSTSGEGLHQVVRGGLRKRGKFIAPIDSEPFVGDDLPQVEIYDGGRHVAMTGRHVVGSDADVVDGQDLIDAAVTEYADAEKDAGHRRYDPETGGDDGAADTDTDRDSNVPDPETVEYSGPSLDALRERRPDGRSLEYHAVVETFYRGGGNADGDAGVLNWRLEGYAAALGKRDGLDAEEIIDDLGGEHLDDTAVEQGCRHETPHRVEYGCDRAGSGRFEAPTRATLVGCGVLPPEAVETDDEEEYGRDPRELEATVDLRRAWDAAGRVEPDETDTAALPTTEDGSAFVCPACGDPVDVVRAAAIAEDLVGDCSEPLDETYSEAYRRARTEYGAPLPEYYTTADAIARFDAVLDVVGEVGFFDLDREALAADITEEGDEVGGDAVRALDPEWRDSESEASVLVFPSGTVWDADTERVLDALRFVALDSGLLTDASDPLEGEAFTEAYRVARTEYGAPLPRWEPATDGARRTTPQLPPAEELLDARDVDGVDPDALEAAREEVEALVAAATDGGRTPTVVASLPGTGKTTGAVKRARERPLSYLAPRKELQQQALDKADRWGVDAVVLPVFSEERVRPEVLDAAVGHVREHGTDRLRDRWSVVAAAVDDETEEDLAAGDIFVEDDEEEDDVDLPRATCPTAEGENGAAWALAVHVARRLGYSPAEIHAEARGLFGAPLPCEDHDHGDEGEADADAECPYSEAWSAVADPDAPPDLLVGSYVHAHVDSVRTVYSRGPDGGVETAPRPVVLDEFPGEAFTADHGEEALDFATWLARSLREDVADRRDMYEADLWADEWVRAWLDGEAAEVDGVGDAIATLARKGELLDAREAAVEIYEEVDAEVLEVLELAHPLDSFATGAWEPPRAYDRLGEAVDRVEPDHGAAGVARWVEEAVVEPLGDATHLGSGTPSVGELDAGALPIAGDLAVLLEGAVEAVRDGTDDARERLEAALAALRGGREGCHRLAAWATDGYAHPDAHHFLQAVAAPTDSDTDAADGTRVETSEWAFDPDATDGTVLDVVGTTERATTVVDRNGHGARLHTPPGRTDAGGEAVPLVGLDATGRAVLWSVVLGEAVDTADIHDTPAERAAFLEDALDLRVIQAADRPRFYEGDPATKDTDGDAALLEAIAAEYSGIDAPRQRGDAPTTVGKPAAITTDGVREVLEHDDRLDEVVAAWENYGNLKGSNDLGAHRLAAILGCQHYGDHAIERFAALAGEEVDTSRDAGRGARLEYDSPVADAYLQHMTADQTMQAVLRFARGDTGATVVARTSALREDLPVVGRGQVVETWSDTATTVARTARRLGSAFTVAEVADTVDVSRRQVRRVLAELAEAGYLRRVDSGPGVASVYEPAAAPGAGEVDLPDRGDAVDAAAGRRDTNQYYTANVRVVDGPPTLSGGETPSPTRAAGAPPAPTAVDGVEPPG